MNWGCVLGVGPVFQKKSIVIVLLKNCDIGCLNLKTREDYDK